jgi:curved DNA-binding protein CbpA
VSHYDVLGVGPTVDQATLHEAYVALARRHHPDREGGDAARMQEINEAWATLGDPARRARYDLALRSTAAPPPPPVPDLDLDEAEEPDDLDDRPVRVTVQLPRALSLLPVAMFAVAVVAFCFGLVSSSQPLLAVALMAFTLSCLFFLAAPFIALFASRRR